MKQWKKSNQTKEGTKYKRSFWKMSKQWHKHASLDITANLLIYCISLSLISFTMPSADRRPLTPTPVLPPSNQMIPGTLSLPLTVVRTCKDEGVRRWEAGMEKGRRGLLLIAQLSQQCCTHSHAISSSTSPSKLYRNPRNLTMSWDRVPKHGTEKKKVSSLEPCHFFSVKALLLVSYLLNPLIVI